PLSCQRQPSRQTMTLLPMISLRTMVVGGFGLRSTIVVSLAHTDRARLKSGNWLTIAPRFHADCGYRGRCRRGRRISGSGAGFGAPLFANRQPIVYHSQFVHRRKMNIVSFLTRVWLGDEFRILVEDAGKLARGPSRFSR